MEEDDVLALSVFRDAAAASDLPLLRRLVTVYSWPTNGMSPRRWVWMLGMTEDLDRATTLALLDTINGDRRAHTLTVDDLLIDGVSETCPIDLLIKRVGGTKLSISEALVFIFSGTIGSLQSVAELVEMTPDVPDNVLRMALDEFVRQGHRDEIFNITDRCNEWGLLPKKGGGSSS